MHHFSPFRYPGGKRRLYDLVVGLLRSNSLSDVEYAEPYAGGAGVALGLLFNEIASSVHLNDLCRPIYAAWHSVVYETEWLCRRVRTVRVSLQSWKRQRAIYDRAETADLRELGFATFFLNRTNRSGIVGGGPIGGQRQDGRWKLDARYNGDKLADRISKVGRYRDRINLYQIDGGEFISSVINGFGQRSFTFIDPPYIERSSQLYLNEESRDYHEKLAKRISRLKTPWILTYDLAALNCKILPNHRRAVYNLKYTAHTQHTGREVMYFSPRLRVPKMPELLGSRMSLVPSLSRLRIL